MTVKAFPVKKIYIGFTINFNFQSLRSHDRVLHLKWDALNCGLIRQKQQIFKIFENLPSSAGIKFEQKLSNYIKFEEETKQNFTFKYILRIFKELF